MTAAVEFRSGKGHRDENFPVASKLIAQRHREPILAFYEFVRTADDIADHPSLEEADKLALLDDLEDALLGKKGGSAEAERLRRSLGETRITPQHAQDLLAAFRMDAVKNRYASWDELIHYCTYSAMPVGRYVLDVHGEDRATWAASDPLCAALQIINHLQDCAKDYRDLNRVYIPLDDLAAEGLNVDVLSAPCAPPALRRCLTSLAARCERLLDDAAPLPAQVHDFRLGLEITVIGRLARTLVRRLQRCDPLSERVHLKPAGVAGLTLSAIVEGAARRVTRRLAPGRARAQRA